MSQPKKVVLAYSGGLDTSIILKWLQTEYRCEVVTFTADLGQGEELEPADDPAPLGRDARVQEQRGEDSHGQAGPGQDAPADAGVPPPVDAGVECATVTECRAFNGRATRCTADGRCVCGAQNAPCAVGRLCCGGQCVNPLLNDRHCGRCFNPCVCVAGACDR